VTSMVQPWRLPATSTQPASRSATSRCANGA
jgi:hypothetical protein